MSKSISILGPAGKPGQVYYPLHLNSTSTSPPEPSGSQLLIRMLAAALNHRDLFIRQHLYPGITFAPVPLFADGCGIVIACGPDVTDSGYWKGKRVVLNPGTGWRDSPEGPEEEFGGSYKIMGGTKMNPLGTLQTYMTIDVEEAEVTPQHLSDVEAAAMPLTGLTAWRAIGPDKLGSRNVGPGKDVLVTGIGGGVALMALAFLSAMGTRVWVTSGNEEKLGRAIKDLGAVGGVNYKEDGWEKKLVEMVKEKSGGKKKLLDGIVDGAGGDVAEKGARIMKNGGVIVSYGMTLGPKTPFPIQATLKNIEIKGSTMGSRKDFKDMVEFVDSKGLRPVVSRIVKGMEDLSAIDGLFEDMKRGVQFGKLVIEIGRDESGDEGLGSKL